MYQNQHYLIKSLLWIVLLHRSPAFSNSCQVYPSVYAYLDSSVTRFERPSTNCRSFPPTEFVYAEDYTYCNGTQLRLADSDVGSEQYDTNDYYVWPAGSSASQLLFIFPARVNLTTITLHYYSDNLRGLPGLRFYAVPDDFDVWEAPAARYRHVDVAAAPPYGGQAGHRNISVNFNLETKKVLLYKHINRFSFSVSEIQFFICNASATTNFSSEAIESNSDTTAINSKYTTKSTYKTSEPLTTSIATGWSARTMTTVSESIIKSISTSFRSNTKTTGQNNFVIGVGTAILVILILTVIATLSLILFWRKLAQRKVDYNSSYSTLCRKGAQRMQSQSVHTSELYDQIQLSPSTGQAEFISRNETANTNNPPPHQTEYDIHPSVDKDKQKSGKLKIAVSNITSQNENKNISEQLTYAVVNKKKKISDKVSEHCQRQDSAPQSHDVTEESTAKHRRQVKQSQDDFEADTKLAPETDESLQNLYSVVKKKLKERPVEDDNPPPIPKYTVEELYTAVKKVPKRNTGGDREIAPQIPSHSIDKLYTAVQKKPKASDSKDEEEAPPIPAHTVEELYTAVMKKPKVTITVDEEEIPQVPPHIMEEL